MLGKYAKYSEVPDNEFDNWLSLLLGQEGMEPLDEAQKEEIKRQLCECLVSKLDIKLLYHAIENTANQDAGKPLYIRRYSIVPSYQSVQFNGITPNLPIVHRIVYVRLHIFYDMV